MNSQGKFELRHRSMFGFLNINKPQYLTSRQPVNKIQKLIRPVRVGHAGTLDPLATGVLVVCVGPATRLTQFVQAASKTYLADFRLGIESDTEDILGTLVDVANPPIVAQQQLEAALESFVGVIEQLPPKFSAVKVDGKRAYRLARKGKDVRLKPRQVTIYKLNLRKFDYPDFQLEICCSTGTYIRSLGRDIGRQLGSGAVMTRLQRTAIGKFLVRDAVAPDEISSQNIESLLVEPQQVLGQLKTVVVPNESLQQFANAQAWEPKEPLDDPDVAAIDEAGHLIAILKRRSGTLFTPKINFSHYWLGRSDEQ